MTLVLTLVIAGPALAQTQSSTRPCVPAGIAAGNTTRASQAVAQATRNAVNPFRNLGSVLGPNKPSPPVGDAPCPAAAEAIPTAYGAQTVSGAGAAPFDPGSGSTAGGNATGLPAAASNIRPDFGKLPDIGGVLRIGLGEDAARAAMLKMHPGYKVVPGATGTLQNLMGRDSQVGGVRGQFLLDAGGRLNDQAFAIFTMPPAERLTFAVERSYPYPAPGIDKLTLVKALREKYGPETKANYPGNSDRPLLGDQNILAMYWVYDEQGHLVAPDRNPGNLAHPYGCDVWSVQVGGTNVWVNMADRYRLNQLPPAGFCDGVVVVSITLGQGSVVTATQTEIDDHALLRRAVIAAGDAAKVASQQAQQQQIDQSKQAKPSL